MLCFCICACKGVFLCYPSNTPYFMGQILLGTFVTSFAGASHYFLPTLFPTNNRYTGASVGFTIKLAIKIIIFFKMCFFWNEYIYTDTRLRSFLQIFRQIKNRFCKSPDSKLINILWSERILERFAISLP